MEPNKQFITTIKINFSNSSVSHTRSIYFLLYLLYVGSIFQSSISLLIIQDINREWRSQQQLISHLHPALQFASFHHQSMLKYYKSCPFIAFDYNDIQTLERELMSNQQAQSFFNDLYMLYSACTFVKDSPLHQSPFQNSPFSFSVSDLQPFDLRTHEELDSPSFETRLEPSIILQSSTFLTQRPAPSKKSPKSTQDKRALGKKPSQKESRNVASNLLRIFLKNVIQLRAYDKTIQRVIESRGFPTSCQGFHEWLMSFGINFKNYIRFTEIRRIYLGGGNGEMHAIFRTVLRHFVKGLGVSHTLTSKRIERTSTPMHLSGLRNLTKELRVI